MPDLVAGRDAGEAAVIWPAGEYGPAIDLGGDNYWGPAIVGDGPFPMGAILFLGHTYVWCCGAVWEFPTAGWFIPPCDGAFYELPSLWTPEDTFLFVPAGCKYEDELERARGAIGAQGRLP